MRPIIHISSLLMCIAMSGMAVASLIISALSGAVGMWGCPQAAWLHWIPVGFLAAGGAFGFVAPMAGSVVSTKGVR